MSISRRFNNKRGSLLLTLACIAVVLLSVLGLAGSAGASSFTAVTEALGADHALSRLMRLALDEAEEAVRQEAAVAGTPWQTALTRHRLEGDAPAQLETHIALPRTQAITVLEQLSVELNASATLVRHNPFGVRARGSLWGGDQTYGTISIKARVRLTPTRGGLFTKTREVHAERLLGFRSTLTEPASPFDRSALWVLDPEFLRLYLAGLKQDLAAACPSAVAAMASISPDAGRDPMYGRVGRDEIKLEWPSVAGLPCVAAGNLLRDDWNVFQDAVRFVEDTTTRKNLEELYWPQMADESFSDEALGRADHAFTTQDELNAFLGAAGSGPVRLSGIYRVSGPVTIDWQYEGRGTIVTPSAIKVTRAVKSQAEATLTLVSTRADIELAGSAADRFDAAIIAVKGAVSGLEGKTVHGLLMAARLGASAGRALHVQIDPALASHQVGEMACDPERLRIHFDDVPFDLY